jgi:agmatinase
LQENWTVSTPTIPGNFLCLPPALAAYQAARYAIMPIPYDASASWRGGAKHGPSAVIAASEHMENYDDELGAEYHTAGIATLEPIEPDVSGPEAMCGRIEQAAGRVLDDRKILIGLGGEHTISIGLFRAIHRRVPDVSVLQIDAHADMRDRYQSSPYSHACVMRRIAESGARVAGVGIRSMSREEWDFLQSRKGQIMAVTSWLIRQNQDWLPAVLDHLGEKVYVTVDIDGFDPGVAPGTGTPEPGGIDWFQACALLRAVAERKQIVGADFVEISPVPGQTVTEHLGARLIYKIICYMEYARERRP